MTVRAGGEVGTFDAGDTSRITKVGRYLRAVRLDELIELNIMINKCYDRDVDEIQAIKDRYARRKQIPEASLYNPLDPKRAPELNPIEGLWGDGKDVVCADH